MEEEDKRFVGGWMVMGGSVTDRGGGQTERRGNGLLSPTCYHPLTVLCYHPRRKRLARELEGQSDVRALQEERVRVMDSTNPRVVLRNYIAQNAIEAAENGDFSEVRLRSAVMFLTFWLKNLKP